MKRILTALLLLLPIPAAANEPVTFFPAEAQNLAYSSASVSITDAIGGYINVVRLVCTSDCYVALAASGQAAVANSVTGIFLPGNVPEYLRVSPNSKVHVIRSSADGTLSVLEMTR